MELCLLMHRRRSRRQSRDQATYSLKLKCLEHLYYLEADGRCFLCVMRSCSHSLEQLPKYIKSLQAIVEKPSRVTVSVFIRRCSLTDWSEVKVLDLARRRLERATKRGGSTPSRRLPCGARRDRVQAVLAVSTKQRLVPRLSILSIHREARAQLLHLSKLDCAEYAGFEAMSLSFSVRSCRSRALLCKTRQRLVRLSSTTTEAQDTEDLGLTPDYLKHKKAMGMWLAKDGARLVLYPKAAYTLTIITDTQA